GEEARAIAEHLRPLPVSGQRGPEQERDVHPRQPELARGPQHRGEHERPDEATRECAPDAHLSAPAKPAPPLLVSSVEPTLTGRPPASSLAPAQLRSLLPR